MQCFQDQFHLDDGHTIRNEKKSTMLTVRPFLSGKFIVGGRLLASHGIRTSVLPVLDNGLW